MILSREQKLMLLRIAVFALLLRLKKDGLAKDEDEGRFIYRQTENNNTVRIDTEKKQIAGGLGGKFDGKKVEKPAQNKSGSPKTTAEEKQKKIAGVKIDFDKDNILPGLNAEDLEGKPDKPVLLKKNIIDRNFERHPDISKEEFTKMLAETLYDRDLIIPEKARSNKASYRHFIKYQPRDHYLVLIEISDEKENYEVVHMQTMNAKKLKKLENKNK